MGSPDYLVRSVKEIDGKERWIDMGVAYRNKRGTIPSIRELKAKLLVLAKTVFWIDAYESMYSKKTKPNLIILEIKDTGRLAQSNRFVLSKKL